MGRWDAIIAARRENVLAAFRSIREQKLRSFLTCLGIIIGVATVIVMVSLIQGFNRASSRSSRASAPRWCSSRSREDRLRRRRPAARGGAPAARSSPSTTRRRSSVTRRRSRSSRRSAGSSRGRRGALPRRPDEQGHGRRGHALGTRTPTTTSWQHGRFFTAGEELHSAQVAVDRHRDRRGALPAHRPARAGDRDQRPAVPRRRRVREEGRIPRSRAPTSRWRSRSGCSTGSGRT